MQNYLYIGDIFNYSRGGGLNLLQNFQKGGPWQDLNFERGIAGKEGVTFLWGEGVQFLQKKKQLKSQMIKSLSTKIFFCHN